MFGSSPCQMEMDWRVEQNVTWTGTNSDQQRQKTLHRDCDTCVTLNLQVVMVAALTGLT